jgi:hypothetical protein
VFMASVLNALTVIKLEAFAIVTGDADRFQKSSPFVGLGAVVEGARRVLVAVSWSKADYKSNGKGRTRSSAHTCCIIWRLTSELDRLRDDDDCLRVMKPEFESLASAIATAGMGTAVVGTAVDSEGVSSTNNADSSWRPSIQDCS